ncbi:MULTISPECIES: ABC transporter permease [Actibacterium]|uniref:Simple sugar transport system permease protein n=1 Tax=Actibacterium naphthalenivorans TaxID=1614693 RepID=A0A840C6G2_9RHOB|nr:MULTISPECIES: ABC transporter permease [Actibacterium]ALG89655.1 ABC transporter permease [Actibacterium sp. EMB200-NS6]MBB4020670.1 simple sugar transport system permease protein [Actibacterium naphthalenivorans]
MSELATTPTVPSRTSALQVLMPRAEAVVIPLVALLTGLIVFSLFLVAVGKSPADFYALVYKAGFSSSFSWQNTLSRVAPLLLAALCVALPARLGLVVIGGEGAIALGGLAAAVVGVWLAGAPSVIGFALMVVAAMLVGGAWIGAVGALRFRRGVNETIASLLMAYIAIALMNHWVEGMFRDPTSLNKPSTTPLPPALRVGEMPIGIDVHWGFAAGVLACIASWVLIERTTLGFAARIAGDNVRAAQVQGLPVGKLIIGFTALGGAFAGLAGFFEVAAVHGSANGSLVSGYGYTGILIAFLARHNPLAIIPVAILLGGFEASSGLIQRRMDLPDATVVVLEGIVFVAILLSETFYGRFRIFTAAYWAKP